LVNRAGASLQEIVESIKKVAEVVSEIAVASAEQATGIEQVNRALTQMDEVTQQNRRWSRRTPQPRRCSTSVAGDERAGVVLPHRRWGAIDVCVRAGAEARGGSAKVRRTHDGAANASRREWRSNRGPVGRMQSRLATGSMTIRTGISFNAWIFERPHASQRRFACVIGCEI